MATALSWGWSPSEFWQSTWHEYTSQIYANDVVRKALAKPRPGETVEGGTHDINDEAALDRIFTKRTKAKR